MDSQVNRETIVENRKNEGVFLFIIYILVMNFK
jgi:hypothetical protein